jgi:hypothetical protein
VPRKLAVINYKAVQLMTRLFQLEAVKLPTDQIGRKVGDNDTFRSRLQNSVKGKDPLYGLVTNTDMRAFGAKGFNVDRRKVLIQMPTGSQLAAPTDI